MELFFLLIAKSIPCIFLKINEICALEYPFLNRSYELFDKAVEEVISGQLKFNLNS